MYKIEVESFPKNVSPARKEEINPLTGETRIRFDFETRGLNKTCKYVDFDHAPSDKEIVDLITDYYNDLCDDDILWGMRYDGLIVNLSMENEFNFKTAFDIAVQTGGKSLPITFKFWKDELTPAYIEFRTIAALTDFYMAALNFVTSTLQKWWSKKDAELRELISDYNPIVIIGE